MISLSKKVVEVFPFFQNKLQSQAFCKSRFSLEKFAKRKPVDFSENITHAVGNF